MREVHFALPPVEGRGRLVWGLFVAGLLYPLWYLLTPTGAVDSPWLWGAVGMIMTVPAIAGLLGLPPRAGRVLAYSALWIQVTHFFTLASLNAMHPFYAVGSVLMVLAPATILTSRRAFFPFAAFVLALALASFLLAPQALKLAYWGPLFLVLPFGGWQLLGRKRAEAALRRYQETLEQRVEASTRSLTLANQHLEREIAQRERAEAELQVWQKLELMARLAGGVAHDFNNILTVIQGHTELLVESLPFGSPLRADAEEIAQMVRRASRLTDQLRAFAAQDPADTRRLDLNALLTQLRSVLISLLGEDIDLHLGLARGAGWIDGNPSQIEQVIVNLAANAREAMPNGGELRIDTELVKRSEIGSLPPDLPGDADRLVRLVVSDSGRGMDAETASRVFDPFFTTKEVGQGSGLGLAAAYGIVRRSGGHIRVESHPGQGTQFEVFWPYEEASEAEQGQVLPPPETGRGELVLVVEDVDAVRRVVKRLLEKWGYRVAEAADARGALEILERKSDGIDLLLSDVVMPETSGIDLAIRFRRRLPNAPVLLMSGHVTHPSLAPGAIPVEFDLISKPFSSDDLRARVRALLDGTVGRANGIGP